MYIDFSLDINRNILPKLGEKVPINRLISEFDDHGDCRVGHAYWSHSGTY